MSDSSFDYSTIGKTSSYIASETTESTSGSNTTLDQEDFLTLLTEQLCNQDPTSPTDTSDMLNTMCQLSVVESLTTITESMDDIVDSVSSATALNASSLVGCSVLVDSNDVYYDGSDSGVNARVSAGDGASDITITITNSSGSVVASYYAASGEGNLDFTWDGTDSNGNQCDAGTYTITATGTKDGSVTSLGVNTYATVSSITLGSTAANTTLSLVGVGDVYLSDVESISK